MTRTHSLLGRRLPRLSSTGPEPVEGRSAATFSLAIALGAVAAVLVAVGSSIPVVAGARPGYLSAPLLIVLALAPMALVAVFVVRGRAAVAAGVLAGSAALAPGRLVSDLQFLADPSATARPELYRPEIFALPGPAAGIWLLLAGLVVTTVAGGVALRTTGVRSEGGARRGALLLGLLAALIVAVGVMMAPFSSNDAFVPVGSAFESPPSVLAGCLLTAFALLVATALAITSGPGLARGGLLGLGVGAATTAVPNLVSGLAVPALGLSAGPIVMLVGIAGLIPVGFARERVPSFGAGSEGHAVGGEAGEARLPGSSRLRAATGVLGLLTTVTALIGVLVPQVVVSGDVPGPQSPYRWLLLAAGLLVGVLGITMFVPRLAERVGPALSVSWSGVMLAATAVLTTPITASELGAGLGPGPAVPWITAAVVFAAAAACCSVVAGMIERDDQEEPAELVPGPALLILLAAGALLAIVAFATPSIVSPEYTEPAVWSNFGTPSWGLLIALLTILGAALLALRSRPGRAAALLSGAAAVTLLRLLALPLVGDQIPGAHPGLGWWLTLGCTILFGLAAPTAATRPAVRQEK